MGYLETMDLYSPGGETAEPRNDWERIDWILRRLGPPTEGSPAADAAEYGSRSMYEPPASESQRGAGVYRREYFEPQSGLDAPGPPRDAINSLGDEMVLLAAGGGVGRLLPFAVRMGRQGISSLSALSTEAEQAAAAISRSFMNRLGRLPTTRELFEALKPHKFLPPSQDQTDSAGAPAPNTSLSSPYGPEQIGNPDQIPARWPVTEAQQTLGEMNDALRGLGGRSFQSYTKKKLALDRYYSGMTSGFDLPVDNVAKRDAAKYPSADFEPASLDRSSNQYSAIRGREQQVIEFLRRLGILENRINSIWVKNPLRNYYMRNAEAEFGALQKLKENEK